MPLAALSATGPRPPLLRIGLHRRRNKESVGVGQGSIVVVVKRLAQHARLGISQEGRLLGWLVGGLAQRSGRARFAARVESAKRKLRRCVLALGGGCGAREPIRRRQVVGASKGLHMRQRH
ncbi:hypothetical protein TESG_08320 [Trichophyton tonsurans CBS 112818]|uniref:Uncharacterized protein n=1 Tax=Trichophyton tonsurans (strain CBS 112818) TaxID=647933 RepID=F2RSD3_TRIT1|nr:hypothetical protein TESG_08320 [Trichophyton tonsurans CBS 112818]